MSVAPKPTWLATYEGAAAGVSDDIGGLIESVEYTDHLAAKSDEVSLTLANHDLRWINGWYPAEGDRIDLKIGYEGAPLLPCGRFRVDKIDMAGADTVTLHALAAGVAMPVRTKRSRPFEGTTLRAIADLLARELGLRLVGDVPDIALGRVTMDHETTLAFLRRLAEEYGYAFSIRDDALTFFELAALEAAKPVVTVSRTELRPGYRFSGKTMGTFVACEVTFFDPDAKKTTTLRIEADKARKAVVLDTTDDEASATPLIPSRTLRQGLEGDDVRGWQEFLSGAGHDPGPIDGIFGPRTRAATLSFQRAGGVAQDGVAGSETYRIAVGQGFNLRATSGKPKGTRTEIAGNVLRQQIRVESVAQAELKARALLAAANRLKATGTMLVVGNPRVMAGVNVELVNMGRLSGRYSVVSSKHRMTKSGSYETEAEVQYVP